MDDFYLPDISDRPVLEGDEFRHCIRVLRRKKGDQIGIFDGAGNYFITRISLVDKDRCELEILEQKNIPQKPFRIHLAIAPTKSTDRMEWMVEKLGELGIDEITFVLTQHSERPKLKTDRLEKKAISAMKQSKSGYLMQINPLIRFSELIKNIHSTDNRFIAVVKEDLRHLKDLATPGHPVTILIGPEGDFSEAEISAALAAGFTPVSLGHNTFRTETAGLMACHVVNIVNDY